VRLTTLKGDMSFSSFSQFADALCKQAGAETPPLNPDSAGMVTFHMIVGDVTVNITHGTCGDGPDSEAFILVTFGLIPADQELEVLTLLAEANFSMLGADMPVLGLNPATAEVVLRHLGVRTHHPARTPCAAVASGSDAHPVVRCKTRHSRCSGRWPGQQIVCLNSVHETSQPDAAPQGAHHSSSEASNAKCVKRSRRKTCRSNSRSICHQAGGDLAAY
jgi:hypothetical protein